MYREKFKQKILELAPRSVLDVGCGDGALINSLQQQGVEVYGLESDNNLVNKRALSSLRIDHGYAEKMQWNDNSVDMVVSEFSLHHFKHYEKALLEFIRVAKFHVLFIDAWYDLAFPSQQLAYEFDCWMKSVDQECGEIHNEVISALAILNAIQTGQAHMQIDIEYWMPNRTMEPKKFATLCTQTLEKSVNKALAARKIEQFRSKASTIGLSEDGVLCFAISL